MQAEGGGGVALVGDAVHANFICVAVVVRMRMRSRRDGLSNCKNRTASRPFSPEM